MSFSVTLRADKIGDYARFVTLANERNERRVLPLVRVHQSPCRIGESGLPFWILLRAHPLSLCSKTAFLLDQRYKL